MKPVRRPSPPRALAALAAGLGLALGTAGCGASAPPARDALLITLDTTRFDALAGFGGDPQLTPHLARLVPQSVRYLEARSVAPVTLPAHASMLTGLAPPRHGLRDNGLLALPPEARTVAEACADAGLRTAAFVSASVLDSVFGLDQGFEVYDQPSRPSGTGGPITQRPGRDTVARAVEWLQRLGPEERSFTWVHLYDPHLPYEPPAEYLERAGGRPYLGEVAAMDAALGELVEALRRVGRFESTLLLVVADHGESLGDHGEPGHGALCYEATIRVPFLLRPPGGAASGGGRASEELVSVSDVAPTLLEGLGLARPAGLDGRSLLGDEPAPEGVYFEALAGYLHYGWSPLAGWLGDDLKYLHSARPELYRLSTDPRERVDLSLVEEAHCRAARGQIQRLLARPALPTQPFDPSRELLATLRSLGYAGNDPGIDAMPSVLEPSDRPAPRDRIGELELLLTGHTLLKNERYAESARVLAGLVAGNPGHAMALDLLGFARMSLGQFEEAARDYERMLELAAPRADALLNLALCYERIEQPARAVATYHELLAIEPENTEARGALERLVP